MSKSGRQRSREDRARLTSAETAELAARLAELTRSGLPLADGLRAVADEESGSREAAGLRRLAACIDAGGALDAALHEVSRAGGLTPELERLLLLGARHNCLPELLEQSIDASARRVGARRQLWTAIAYPVILLLGMSVLWAGLELVMFAPMQDIYADFDIDVPAMTTMVLALGRVSVVFCAIVIGLLLVGPLGFAIGRRWEPTWWIVGSLPLLGPMCRWQSLAQLGRGLAMALGGARCGSDERSREGSSSGPAAASVRQPMPDALRLAVAGIADVELRRKCDRMVERLEQGLTATEVFSQAGVFPVEMASVFYWAEQHDTWPETFESISTWYESLARNRVRLIELAFPPVIVFLVATMLVFITTATMMPLISLIQRLT